MMASTQASRKSHKKHTQTQLQCMKFEMQELYHMSKWCSATQIMYLLNETYINEQNMHQKKLYIYVTYIYM